MKVSKRHRAAAVIALLLAVTGPAARPATARAAAPATLRLEYRGYQELLNEHLWITSEPGEPLETRFNYEKFFDERGRAERAFRIRRQFLSVDPGRLDARNRTAWAINFYNFLVLEQLTDQLLVPRAHRQRRVSIEEFSTDEANFFKTPIVRIDTTEYSLDGFERHFLFQDFDRAPGSVVPRGLDPRIHFALVCGAVGCPPLQPRAFKAESLEIQLNAAVRGALASPRHFQRTVGANAVRMSAIFFWYPADFGGQQAALQWALPYLPKGERLEIEKMKPAPAIAQLPWDWKINQIIGWRFVEQMNTPLPGVPRKPDSK